MSWNSQKKKEGNFCTVYFVWRIFLTFVLFPNVYCIQYTCKIYMYFYISKNITSYSFLLVFKIVKSLQCILKEKNSNDTANSNCAVKSVVYSLYALLLWVETNAWSYLSKRFGILELQNWVKKSSHSKWRHTSSYHYFVEIFLSSY